MKRIAALTSLALLLSACGSQPQPNTSTPDSGGFLVDGKPDFKARKVTLPASQTLPLRSTAASQSLRSASLPAWTGPTSFPTPSRDFPAPTISINSNGSLFFNRYPDYYGWPTLTKFSPNGQVIGEQVFPTISNFGPAEYWTVVTEDSPTEETYQIVGLSRLNSSGLYDEAIQTQILSDSMKVLNTNVDGPNYNLYGISGDWGIYFNNTVFKAGGKGIVMLANRRPDYSNRKVDVYELSHEPWDSVEPDQRTTFFRPSRYSGEYNYINTDIATSSDGSIYVAMFVNYRTGCDVTCPSVVGITKIVNGEIIWQDYWDADEPIQLRDIAANNTSVSLLVTRKVDANYTQHILTFNSNGDPQSDKQIPLDAMQNQDPRQALGFGRLELEDNGKFVLMGSNVLASGDLVSGSIDHTFLLPAETGWFQDIAVRGDYVYAQGHSGDDFKDVFILPLDINLNRR